jgi:hypothetical protein
MVQAAGHWHLSAEDRVGVLVSRYRLCGVQSGTETGFCPSSSAFSF